MTIAIPVVLGVMLALALFGAAAVVGRRTWVPCLAIGWAAHVAWDLALHRSGAGAVYTPAWYPWFCVGFDLTLAACILALGVEECNEHIDRRPDTVEGSRGLFAEDTGVCRPDPSNNA